MECGGGEKAAIPRNRKNRVP